MQATPAIESSEMQPSGNTRTGYSGNRPCFLESAMFKQSSDVAASSGKIEIVDVELSSGGFLVDAVEAYRAAGTAPAGVEIAAEVAGDVAFEFHVEGRPLESFAKVSGFERLSSVPPGKTRFRKFRRETNILFSI